MIARVATSGRTAWVASAWMIHQAGAKPTRTSDVAFTPPTAATVNANRAGHRQPPSRTERMVNDSSQPSPAQGSKMADSRAA